MYLTFIYLSILKKYNLNEYKNTILMNKKYNLNEYKNTFHIINVII